MNTKLLHHLAIAIAITILASIALAASECENLFSPPTNSPKDFLLSLTDESSKLRDLALYFQKRILMYQDFATREIETVDGERIVEPSYAQYLVEQSVYLFREFYVQSIATGQIPKSSDSDEYRMHPPWRFKIKFRAEVAEEVSFNIALKLFHQYQAQAYVRQVERLKALNVLWESGTMVDRNQVYDPAKSAYWMQKLRIDSYEYLKKYIAQTPQSKRK